MEREHTRLLERAAKIAEDIAERKRINAEYSGETAAPPQQGPIDPPQATAPEQKPQRVWRFEPFDGTFASLIRRYRADSGSPYFKLHWKVRKNYDVAINRLMMEIGAERVADFSASRILALYDHWKAGGKLATAHGLVGKVRMLAGFGTTNLNDDSCIRLSTILSKMEFELPEVRNERLTEAQAIAIRAKAHELGRPSIALAQAFQFDLKIQQVDVIGEWVPLSEPGSEDIVWDDQKWIRGMRWSDIDGNLILRRSAGPRQRGPKELEVDLRTMPMIMEELRMTNSGSRDGPLIVNEWNGKPWKATEFRRWWRRAANAAGVPLEIKNMDNRKEDASENGRGLGHGSSKELLQ